MICSYLGSPVRGLLSLSATLFLTALSVAGITSTATSWPAFAAETTAPAPDLPPMPMGTANHAVKPPQDEAQLRPGNANHGDRHQQIAPVQDADEDTTKVTTQD